jgi:hypothetical protein
MGASLSSCFCGHVGGEVSLRNSMARNGLKRYGPQDLLRSAVLPCPAGITRLPKALRALFRQSGAIDILYYAQERLTFIRSSFVQCEEDGWKGMLSWYLISPKVAKFAMDDEDNFARHTRISPADLGISVFRCLVTPCKKYRHGATVNHRVAVRVSSVLCG